LIGVKGYGVSYAGAEKGDKGMALKIRLFLGSLSSSRNHARSPPDDFLISLPDCFKTSTVLEMVT
jgi:hypothetical protein